MNMHPAEGHDRRFAATLAILLLLALFFAVLPEGLSWQTGEEVAAREGSALRRLQWLPLFAASALLIWARREVAYALLRFVNPFLLGFIAWALLSMTWSGYPGVTLRKGVLLVGSVSIAASFQVAAWDANRLRRLLRLGITTLLIASLVAVFVAPSIARVSAYNDAWVGVTQSKNHLGLLAGFGSLLWLHALAVGDGPPLRALVATAFCLGMLLMSQSATSLGCTLALVPATWLMLRPPIALGHSLFAALLALLLVGACSAFIVLILFGVPTWQDFVRPVADLLGRDITLTGRLQIWTLTVAEIVKHPWLGTGYGAFWLGAGGPAPWLTQNLYGILWQAHDGYLDVLNETGLIGMALVLGFIGVHLRQIGLLASHDRGNAVLHAVFLAFFLLSNIAESSLFRPIHFMFFLSIVMSLSLSRAVADLAVSRPQWSTAGAERGVHR
ncbi:O-antigen ligase family protein [Salinisphaera sp. T31B1]|uniref:O-antigen ligase family protein n=1 Tax=Salinisphaera sp. T31B1 TaxID=727963 RepID=UPI0033424419